MEVFADNSISTLVGALTDTAVTLTVADASTFPTRGDFRMRIDAELILVKSPAGAVFSGLVRGIEGSVATAHADGAVATHILTAGGLSNGIIDSAQAILTGVTAGNIVSSQPHQAGTYKKFVAFMNGYQNATPTPQVITFAASFAQPPFFTANSDPECTADALTLTLPASMTSPTTGWVILEGW